jgi:hypothetical protein
VRKSITVAVAAAVLSGCATPPPPAPPVNDGFLHLDKRGTFSCNGQPVAYDGSHANVTLDTDCARIRVSGSHNDVVAYVVPNATIEVTGDRNTIVYRLLRAGPKPQWINRGDGNNLVRNSNAPWEQDHDWYQEKH